MNSTTKDHILNCARFVVRTEGSAGFSMRLVAVAADMSLGNLQYHFRTKARLFEALLRQYLSQYREGVEELMTGPLTRERLSEFILAVLNDEANDDERDIYAALYSYAEAGGLSDDAMDQFVKELYELLLDLLESTECDTPKNNLHLACSLLIPYFGAYGSLHGRLGGTIGDICALLTRIVWELICPNGAS